MLFLVISHLSILAVLPFFIMSSKRPQSARQPAPMPAVEGVAEARKEAEESRHRQHTEARKEAEESRHRQHKMRQGLHKIGEQLMTAALTTAINAAPAVSSAAAVPPAAAASIASQSSITPEPRNIYSPNGDGTMYTFSEVVQLVREGRYTVQDFARSFMFRPEYWRLIEQFLRKFQLSQQFTSIDDPQMRFLRLRRQLVLSPKFQHCCEWAGKQIIESNYEMVKHIAANNITRDSEEDRRIVADRISYVNKTKAWAIEQILQDHPDIFPGAAEEASKVFNQIFQWDERGNIVPYHYKTHFGADTRDTEYLECLLKMLPEEAKRIFKATFIGISSSYPRH